MSANIPEFAGYLVYDIRFDEIQKQDLPDPGHLVVCMGALSINWVVRCIPHPHGYCEPLAVFKEKCHAVVFAEAVAPGGG